MADAPRRRVDLLARRRLIEQVRGFLRENDFVFGYFPQLVMERRPSEWWSLFWYCVRRLDDLLDAREAPGSPGEHLLDGLLPGDFGAAMRVFLEETSERVPRALLDRLYDSTRREQAFSKPPSVGRYLDLLDRKAVIPVRICARLNGLDDRDPTVDRLVVSLGRGVQLLDDLLDLAEDRRRGRRFITREELTILGLEEHEIDADLESVSGLRSRWILAATAPAYDAVHQRADNPFCLAARSWIEAIWKLIADGKATPLSRKVLQDDSAFARYIGVSTLPFDLAPVSEQLKHRLYHPVTVAFLRGYRVFDASGVGRLVTTSGRELDPLLEPLGGPAARRALAVAESWGRRDERRLINLDRGAGLPQVGEELSRIALSVGSDGVDEALMRLESGGTAAFAADLVSRVGQSWRDVVTQELDRGSEAATAALAGEADGASRIVSLGLDWLSIAVEHGFALHDEILDRVAGRGAAEAD